MCHCDQNSVVYLELYKMYSDCKVIEKKLYIKTSRVDQREPRL